MLYLFIDAKVTEIFTLSFSPCSLIYLFSLLPFPLYASFALNCY